MLIRAVIVLCALANPAIADPLEQLGPLVTLQHSGRPAVVDAMFGAERPSDDGVVLGGGIVAWPVTDAKHRVDEVVLRFEADYPSTVALLEKAWGPPQIAGTNARPYGGGLSITFAPQHKPIRRPPWRSGSRPIGRSTRSTSTS